jgi:hypothetical protein
MLVPQINSPHFKPKINVKIILYILIFSVLLLSLYLYGSLEELDGTIMLLLKTEAISCGTPSSRGQAILCH